MAETFCGKSCSNCDQKEKKLCPGCRVGPGRKFGGVCNIAKCCTSKNYHACELCANASTCNILRGRHRADQTRTADENHKKQAMKHKYETASVLGKWLMISFWICIAVNAAEVIFMIASLQADVSLAKSLCSIALGIMNVVALFRLSAVCSRFRISAIMAIVSIGIDFLSPLAQEAFLMLVLTLASSVVLIVAEYQRFMGYIEVTEEFESELSGKWSSLWSAYFICLCVSALGLLLSAFGIGIAALAVMLASVGALVASIIRIVYLYRTAVYFRDMATEYQHWNLIS